MSLQIYASKFLNPFLILLLALYSIAVWWPTRYLPFYGDAAAFINRASNQLVATNFEPLIAVGSDFAHPPLLPFSLALIKTIFPPTLYAMHLPILPFFFLYLISVYLILKKFTTPLIGFCGAFILGFIPPVVVEAGNIYIDLPAYALALSAVVLYLANLYLPALFTLIFAVMVKETAILYLPFFYFYPSPVFSKKKKIIFVLSVSLSYLIWLIYHYVSTGWFFFSPESRIHDRYLQSVFELINTFAKILTVTFIQQYRLLLFIPFVVSIVIFLKNKLKYPRLIQGLVISYFSVILSIFAFYLLATEFLSRYALILLPLVIIASLTIWHWFIKLVYPTIPFSVYLIVYTLVVCFSFSLAWHPKTSVLTTYDFRPVNDLRYQDVIHLFSQAGAFLSANYASALVMGTFPENIYLTDPTAGYVVIPLKFLECNRFNLQSLASGIVVTHPFSPGQIDCQRLLKTFPNRLLISYQSNDKWLDIYELVASPSASPHSSLKI